MKKSIIINESEKQRILNMHSDPSLKRKMFEQSSDENKIEVYGSYDGKKLDQILIDNFIDTEGVDKTYKDPAIKDDFYNDYSSKFQDWLVKNGFKMSDINLSVGGKPEDIKRVNFLIKQKSWN
jgi:hypothetical protein